MLPLVGEMKHYTKYDRISTIFFFTNFFFWGGRGNCLSPGIILKDFTLTSCALLVCVTVGRNLSKIQN